MVKIFLDEKEKYDPTAFRDSIISGISECGGDLELVSRFLDKEGSKLDYRRYAEVLFDTLFAGGILGKFIFFIINTTFAEALYNYISVSTISLSVNNPFIYI